MKNMFIPAILLSLVIISCNNDKPKEQVTITDKDSKEQITINTNDLQGAAEDLQKRRDELTNMTPLTSDELKALIPAQLMDGVQTDLDISSAMGATVASANYKVNDTVNLDLEIVDCAGPGGAGFFGTQYMMLVDTKVDDEDEYTRTIDFNGGKAIEMCKKKRNRCSLTYFSENRFIVMIKGENTGIDALKDVAKGLELK